MTEQAPMELSRQYLTLELDSEAYALPIDRVREVVELGEITRVPRTPDFMRGVINLRGSVVPVIDLSRRFGLRVSEPTVDSAIVITEVTVDGEPVVLGILADAVEEVIELAAAEIEPAPTIGTRLDTSFIAGMGKREDSFVTILAIDRVLAETDFSEVRVEARGDLEGEAA